MADNADRAADITQQTIDAQLARRVPINCPAPHDECVDCGYVIPAARRQAAPWATTCIECQSVRELRGRHVR